MFYLIILTWYVKTSTYQNYDKKKNRNYEYSHMLCNIYDFPILNNQYFCDVNILDSDNTSDSN